MKRKIPLSPQPSTSNFRTPTTRRKTAANIAESSSEEREFSVVHTRTGQKSINEKVIRYTVPCLSKYKVSQNDFAGITVMTANTIFGQARSAPADARKKVSSDFNSDKNIQGFRGEQIWLDSEEVFGKKRVHYEFLN